MKEDHEKATEIEMITFSLESWNFVNTTAQADFFAKFRRLVDIGDIRYAEVDHSPYINGERNIRYVRLSEFLPLAKCKAGDDLHCRWLHGIPYVFAAAFCKIGRKITKEEWD